MHDTIGNDPQAPGICYRLFSYIINSLFAHRVKHLGMDRQPLFDDDTSIEVLIEDSSGDSSETERFAFRSSRHELDSDIVIEFKHKNENSENWNDEKVHDGLKKNDIKAIQENKSDTRYDEKGTRKKVSIEDAADKETTKKKEKNDVRNGTILVNQAEEEKPRPPGRHRRSSSGISSINEKLEAFIQSKKEAMRKNYSLEPEKH